MFNSVTVHKFSAKGNFAVMFFSTVYISGADLVFVNKENKVKIIPFKT